MTTNQEIVVDRFVPLHYDSFKRLVFRLKKTMGVRHTEALDTISRACGFRDFNAVVFIHRPDEPRPVPAALQCAGELGFDAWCEQMRGAVGAEVLAEMGPDLRRWYQRVFVPGVDLTNWLSRPTQQGPVAPDATALGPGTLPAVEDGDSVALPARAFAAAAVVTYRRRRRIATDAPLSSEPSYES